MVIVWRHKLESHIGGFDLFLAARQEFVVEDLVSWNDALVLHSRKCASTCQNHFSLRFVLHWLHPSGVPVNVVEQHMILVVAAGA